MIKNKLLSKNQRLTSTDTINKFLIVKSNEKLIIRELNLKIMSKNLLFNNEVIVKKGILQKTTGVIINYLLNGTRPIIKSIKKAGENKDVSKKSNSLKEEYFHFNFKTSNNKNMYNFIEKLFIDYNFCQKNLNVDNLDKIEKQQKNILNYNTKLFLGEFIEQNDFFKANNSSCLFSNIPISTNFVFHNFSKHVTKNLKTKNFIVFQLFYI